MAFTNELYLAVLPLVHLNNGLTEQTLTLFPDRNFASHFDENEVDSLVAFFQSRAQMILSGGAVEGYQFMKERVPDGRVIVRVIQSVR